LKIGWHAQARLDLVNIVRYVAEDNLDAALRLRDAIRGQIALLAEMPEMGRRGRVPGTRELVIAGTRYVVPYMGRGIGRKVSSVDSEQLLQPGLVDDIDA
jgi:toxin ParE1/3/4